MDEPHLIETYVIRQKILVFFGASFEIFGADGSLVGFCRQKAFKLREDIRVYRDKTATTELFAMRARSVIDFSAAYDVTLPSGDQLGSLKRRGLKSMLRDTWTMHDAADRPIATLREDSGLLAMLRRLLPVVGLIVPQRFMLLPGEASGGPPLAEFRTRFNPFVYRLAVSLPGHDAPAGPEAGGGPDELLVVAAACLIAAIEGRQQNGGGGSGLFSGA